MTDPKQVRDQHEGNLLVVKARIAKCLDIGSLVLVSAAVLYITVSLSLSRLWPPAQDSNAGAAVLEQRPLSLNALWLGPEEAAVTVIVYSDYGCGFCKQLNDDLRRLRQRYPDHLAVAFKHFTVPSIQSRLNVVLGVECAADQNRSIEYHEAVFANQHMTDYTNGWLALADSAGIPDATKYAQCVRSRAHSERIAQHAREAAELGFHATPSILINDEVVIGAPPSVVLDSIIVSHFRGRRKLLRERAER